jgi:hypothetical protein
MVEINTKDLRLVYQEDKTLHFCYENGMLVSIEFPTLKRAKDILENWITTASSAIRFRDVENVKYTYVS